MNCCCLGSIEIWKKIEQLVTAVHIAMLCIKKNYLKINLRQLQAIASGAMQAKQHQSLLAHCDQHGQKQLTCNIVHGSNFPVAALLVAHWGK